MSLVVSSEDPIEQVFLSNWVIHHDGIMEGDPIVCQATSYLWPLIKISFYELCSEAICAKFKIPYSRKIWWGIKYGGLAVYVTTAKNFLLAHIHIIMAILY